MHTKGESSTCHSPLYLTFDVTNGVLYSKDKKKLINAPHLLSSIEIPESVIQIESFAFFYCSSLTSVTIPNSVTSIGKEAFFQCGLSTVKIPTSVNSIGENAFGECSHLPGVSIPPDLTVIEDGVFYGCSGFTAIQIPS